MVQFVILIKVDHIILMQNTRFHWQSNHHDDIINHLDIIWPIVTMSRALKNETDQHIIMSASYHIHLVLNGRLLHSFVPTWSNGPFKPKNFSWGLNSNQHRDWLGSINGLNKVAQQTSPGGSKLNVDWIPKGNPGLSRKGGVTNKGHMVVFFQADRYWLLEEHKLQQIRMAQAYFCTAGSSTILWES